MCRGVAGSKKINEKIGQKGKVKQRAHMGTWLLPVKGARKIGKESKKSERVISLSWLVPQQQNTTSMGKGGV